MGNAGVLHFVQDDGAKQAKARAKARAAVTATATATTGERATAMVVAVGYWLV